MVPSVNADHSTEHILLEVNLEVCDDFPDAKIICDDISELEERLTREHNQIEEQKQAEEKLFKGVLWVVFIIILIVVVFLAVAMIVNRRSKLEPEADEAIKNNPIPRGKLPRKSFWNTTNKIVVWGGIAFSAYFASDYVCHYVGYCK